MERRRKTTQRLIRKEGYEHDLLNLVKKEATKASAYASANSGSSKSLRPQSRPTKPQPPKVNADFPPRPKVRVRPKPKPWDVSYLDKVTLFKSYLDLNGSLYGPLVDFGAQPLTVLIFV